MYFRKYIGYQLALLKPGKWDLYINCLNSNLEVVVFLSTAWERPLKKHLLFEYVIVAIFGKFDR